MQTDPRQTPANKTVSQVASSHAPELASETSEAESDGSWPSSSLTDKTYRYSSSYSSSSEGHSTPRTGTGEVCIHKEVTTERKECSIPVELERLRQATSTLNE